MDTSWQDDGKSVARGIAAFIVVLDHTYGLFIEPHLGSSLISTALALAAHQSVMLFFTISGFLITKSILNNIRLNGKFRFQPYFIARIARIYPPLVFSIIICTVFLFVIQSLNLPGSVGHPYRIGTYPGMRDYFEFSLTEAISALKMNNGMLQVNGPLWSLVIEFWIYLVVGVTVLVGSSSGWWRRLLLSMVAMYFVKKLFEANEHSGFYLLVWISGALVSVCYHILGWFKSKNAKSILTFAAFLVLATYSFPNLVLAGGRTFGIAENLVQFLIVAFWAAIVLPPFKLQNSALKRLLVRLGDSSYTLYITHFPILLFLLSLYQFTGSVKLTNSILVGFFGLGLSVVISATSADVLENKKFFAKWIENGLQRLKTALIR